MCGRFILSADLLQLKKRFDIAEIDFDYQPRYNIAPTQNVPVIIKEARNHLKLMSWGLIPFWAKDPSVGSKLINARGESLLEKPSFKNPFLRRRCLIPATGFYEWQKIGQSKIPKCIILKNRELFGFAGLWDSWQAPGGEWLETFTIITTGANELVNPIHNRMPVILSKEEEALWLDPKVGDTDALNKLLNPYPAELMTSYAVSPMVNSPKNDNPILIEPV